MTPATYPLILVVDDDTRTARRLAELLREDGYKVEVVCDGALAVGRLSRSPLPDVLITDVQLPHVDGVAVAQYARSGRPNVRVIFVTGYPELVDGERDDAGSPALVFTKPLDYEALHAALPRRCAEPS